MPIDLLKKGQRVDLTKDTPNLKRLMIGLGWDPIARRKMFCQEEKFDIDASVICIRPDGRHESTIYFNNKEHSSGAIIHKGDNLTGDGDGDDEQIEIRLDKVPATVDKMVIIINIYKCDVRNQHFGQVKNCFVRAKDMDTGRQLLKYQISDKDKPNPDYNGKTGLFFGEVYRHNGEWKFRAMGEGVNVRSIKEMERMKCNP